MREPEPLLGEVRSDIASTVIRVERLLADLTLLGFAVDVCDSAEAALVLAESAHPEKASALNRGALESAQQALLLATASDYEEAGCLAWLHYLEIDKKLRRRADGEEVASRWYSNQLSVVEKILAAHGPDHSAVLARCTQLAATRRRARVHWHGGDVATGVTSGYRRIVETLGGNAPDEGLSDVNRNLYAALSRETHGHWRLDVESFHVDRTGAVGLVTRPRDRIQARANARLNAACSLFEVHLALMFRRASA